MFIPPTKPVILVTGSDGQLGQELRHWARDQDEYEILFTNRYTMDVTSPKDVLNIFSKWRPSFCIHCAAYTAVDKAEEEHSQAYLINRDAVQNLVRAAQEVGTKLINISTDYVYHSVQDHPIRETDLCTPKSIYGKSKRAGEKELEQSSVEWINIRVSWLYSSYANNFVKTMLRLGAQREELTIVADQIGAPTYARDLAHDIMNIIQQVLNTNVGVKEHYNYSNAGQTNWADFARAIFSVSKISCTVHETSTEAYGAPAPRPLWSVMDKSKIKTTFDLDITSWKHALTRCLLVIDSVV